MKPLGQPVAVGQHRLKQLARAGLAPGSPPHAAHEHLDVAGVKQFQQAPGRRRTSRTGRTGRLRHSSGVYLSCSLTGSFPQARLRARPAPVLPMRPGLRARRRWGAGGAPDDQAGREHDLAGPPAAVRRSTAAATACSAWPRASWLTVVRFTWASRARLLSS